MATKKALPCTSFTLMAFRKMYAHYPRPRLLTLTFFLLAAVAVMPCAAAMDDFELYQFKPSDHRYLELGIERIEARVERAFGSHLRSDTERVLALLQRLLDDGLVTADDRRGLQDMGMVFGELLRKDLGMHWVFYLDHAGRSRALQLRHSRHFLFPVTMISRRAETGLRVDVSELYAKAKGIIEPHRHDFSAQQYRHLRKIAKP